MADVAWQMNDQTIVRKVADTATQDTLPDPKLEKMRQGGKMRFDAHVNVDMMPQGKHLKKVTIFSNVPNGGTWELISDEGVAVGGRGSAPSPLMYVAAGVGLCMMSHIEMLAASHAFEITSARLEQRSSWTTTMTPGAVDPASVFGHGEAMELNVLIESPESAERMSEFLGYCRQACMALQTVAAATPVTTRLFLNDVPVGQVGGTGPNAE